MTWQRCSSFMPLDICAARRTTRYALHIAHAQSSKVQTLKALLSTSCSVPFQLRWSCCGHMRHFLRSQQLFRDTAYQYSPQHEAFQKGANPLPDILVFFQRDTTFPNQAPTKHALLKSCWPHSVPEPLQGSVCLAPSSFRTGYTQQ